MKKLKCFALSCNLLIKEIYRYLYSIFSIKLRKLSTPNIEFLKNRFGRLHITSSKDLQSFIKRILSIEISSLLIFFSTIDLPKLVILTLQNIWSTLSPSLKLEPLTMLLHKSGMKSLTTIKVIFGHLDVCCMRWQCLGLHLELTLLINYSKR